MKNILLILFIFLAIFYSSCENETAKIQGVWIFDYGYNLKNVTKNKKLNIYRYPILYNFKNDGTIKIKNFGSFDTSYCWSMDSVNLFKSSSFFYKIKEQISDSLVLLEANESDSFIMVLKRPLKNQITQSLNEIKNILTSNVWTIQGQDNNHWQKHFEFFPKNVVIYRYEMFDKVLNINTDKIQLELWGVAEYENLFFLYNYADEFVWGGLTGINQIVQISENSYKIVAFDGNKPNQIVYNAKDIEIIPHDTFIKKLIGHWESLNDSTGNYGKPISEVLTSKGFTELFKGKLHYFFFSDTLCGHQVGKYKLNKVNYFTSKDQKTIIFDYPYQDEWVSGHLYKFANILYLDSSVLKIRLFDNHYYTGISKPNSGYLNIIQNFKKISDVPKN